MGRTFRALPPEMISRPHFKRLRNIWYGVKHRTSNPKHCHFPNYGARGITLCERWRSIENFYADMVSSYEPGMSLERIDNDKGYSPENCKWANEKVQANNTRRNRLVTYKGETKTLTQWAEARGLSRNVVNQRYYCLKWPIERVLGPLERIHV